MKLTQRYRKLNFWNKLFVWAALCTFSAFVLFLLLQPFAATKSNQAKSLKNEEKTLIGIEEITQMIGDKEAELKDYLSKKYPLGYSLFGVYNFEVIVPEKSVLNDNFEFRWDVVKVNEINQNYISLTLPGIYDKRKHNLVSGHKAILPLKKGAIVSPLLIVDTIVTVEMVGSNTPYIFAIGFKPEK
ncbi:MAG: hypothetical protein H8E62_03825 [Planctomycetes bacterium]|nr:hypothetical protein [Planctomycetota bacterium]